MFALALLFLAIAGLALPHGGISDNLSEHTLTLGPIPLSLMLLWLIIVAESLAGVMQGRDPLRSKLLRCGLVSLLPPFRLALATAVPHRLIWLPRLGWQVRDEALFEHLEWALAIPLLLVTLLILPIVTLEIFFHDALETSSALAWAVHLGSATIWCSFAFEFILLVSVTERKLQYCKHSWINIAIIVLPLLAFLRTLQLFRVLRLAKAGKLLRAYRLRGLVTRAQRIVLLLNLIERILHRKPEKYLAALRQKEQDKLRELDEIRVKIRAVEDLLAENRSAPSAKTLD